MTPEPARAADGELAPRRLDQFADRERESADLLTADRLLDPHQLTKPEPEGLWSHLLYTVSGNGGTAVEFGEILAAAIEKWARVIKFAGIKAD